MVRSSSLRMSNNSSGKNSNTKLYVLLGVFALAIIIGTIAGTAYHNRELFTNSKRLVYLYMANCPHCTTFTTEWNKIQDAVKNDPQYSDLILEKHDLSTDVGKKYAKDNNIDYAPAILYIYSKTIEYNGSKRTSPEILKWVSDQSLTIPNVTNV